ncbi:hypothetical protein ACKVEX_16180 [Rhodocyclaceae bacterium SMB388]
METKKPQARYTAEFKVEAVRQGRIMWTMSAQRTDKLKSVLKAVPAGFGVDARWPSVFCGQETCTWV